ncbi:hypothetical protein [Microbispora catharanthi]|uniref:Uncharacterized protein n=1 Tax=Microbispora catharanthi TaxID=1712871 RepID=A0A5N6BEC4_9ACTN|nr:hypothetical protein [Microbispora catharanthi]KAB8178782.1 hypothetical protein FH610_036040 [Microbispora catharanthi]
MTAATPGRGRGEHGGQEPLTPPDPTGLEAWIRQVLGLAGARASAFAPPLPLTPSADRDHPGDADRLDPDGQAE